MKKVLDQLKSTRYNRQAVTKKRKFLGGKKEIKKVLLVSTGALMSTTSSLQGETIPGIAHAVAIEMN